MNRARRVSPATVMLYAMFTLGFVAGLWSMVLEPRTAEVMAYATCLCGFMSLVTLVLGITEVL